MDSIALLRTGLFFAANLTREFGRGQSKSAWGAVIPSLSRDLERCPAGGPWGGAEMSRLRST